MTAPIDADNAEHYVWGNGCHGWHLLKTTGLSVIEEEMPPGTQESRHFHSKAHQFFYVLAGEAACEINGHSCILRPHQGVSVPPGVPHQLFNQGGTKLRFLVISSPPSHGDRTLAE